MPAPAMMSGWEWSFRRSIGGCAARSLRRAAFFAPEPKFFLHRPIGEGKQHEIVIGAEFAPHPGRTDEHVLGRESEALLADDRGAAPFGDRKDRAVRRAIGRGVEALGDKLNRRTNCRHHP